MSRKSKDSEHILRETIRIEGEFKRLKDEDKEEF